LAAGATQLNIGSTSLGLDPFNGFIKSFSFLNVALAE